jgi:hypothetical protein
MKKLIISILVCISATSVALAQGQTDSSLGTVEIPDGVIVVVTNSDNAQITLEPVDGVSELPAGRYRIDRWTIERYVVGQAWKLEGAHFGDEAVFDVSAGQTVKLTVGEPVISSVTVSSSGSRHRFDHSLIGRLSEIVELSKDGGRPEPPQLKIRNADGSYQQTIPFRYG